MWVRPPGVSAARPLWVSKEGIRVAIILTPRGRRQTLLIGVETAIACHTVVVVTLDAERVVPGSSGVRHHSGCSDSTNREGCQEKNAHHSISSVGRRTARASVSVSAGWKQGSTSSDYHAHNPFAADNPVHRLQFPITLVSGGQPLWWRKPQKCRLNESQRSARPLFRLHRGAACSSEAK